MLTLPFLKLRRMSVTGLLMVLLTLLSACAKRAHIFHTQANDQQPPRIQSSSSRININTTSAKELEMLPGIGKSLAERIIEHREKYGRFRRSEHLIIVRGISDRRFRALRAMITVN